MELSQPGSPKFHAIVIQGLIFRIIVHHQKTTSILQVANFWVGAPKAPRLIVIRWQACCASRVLVAWAPIFIYIYIYVNTNINIYKYIYIDKYTYINRYIYIYIHIEIDIYIYT